MKNKTKKKSVLAFEFTKFSLFFLFFFFWLIRLLTLEDLVELNDDLLIHGHDEGDVRDDTDEAWAHTLVETASERRLESLPPPP